MLARLPATVALIVLFCFCGSASARLPDFQNNRIAAKSIGGVRVGMSLKQVKAAWGSGGYDYSLDAQCVPDSDECTWRRSVTTKAWVGLDNGRVEGIGIAGGRRSRPGRLRTRAGYGLGTKSEVFFRKGCPSGPVGLGAPLGAGAVYSCGGIRFYVSRSSGRTIAVVVG